MKKFNPRMTQTYHKGRGAARIVLLLTTTGRKSGLARVTPLQYEEVDGEYYVASARGAQADWYRNIKANPAVKVNVHGWVFQGTATTIEDVGEIADFLELRIKRHPLFIRVIMHLEGLSVFYKRADLEQFALRKTMVRISPSSDSPKATSS